MISIIVAADEKNVIGNENKLIWHLPADLTYFKQTTMGKPIVMGRKTFESIGHALPGRKNIVLTRSSTFLSDNINIINNPAEILFHESNEEIMIIGGAEVYRIFLPFAKRIYLTRIHHSFEGDTYFPEVDLSSWKKISEDNHQADEKNKFDYSFLVYEKV